MYIQVLTFRLSPDHFEEGSAYCRNALLGLAEFDGYVSDTSLAQTEGNSYGGMIAWRDWKALEAFRHSELYARLLMSPHFEDVIDSAFGVAPRATAAGVQQDLLAAA